MGRVQVSETGFAYAVESALGELGSPSWRRLEPNSIGSFGATISTIVRQPLGGSRRRQKGTITDLTSAVDFDHDLTLTAFQEFVEGLLFAKAINGDVTDIPVSAATTSGLTVTGLAADQTAKLGSGSLVWVHGFGTTGNNGLKVLSANATATKLTAAASTFTAETKDAYASFAGRRFTTVAAGAWVWDSANNQATLTLSNIGSGSTGLPAYGVVVGQMIHVGSIASRGGAIQNAFQATGSVSMHGYARVQSIASGSVVFDKVGAELRATSVAGGTIDLVFGQYIRDVDADDADYLSRSFQFEAAYPGLGDEATVADRARYQYALGNYLNTLAFNLPLTEKATMALAFVGTDTPEPSSTRKTNANSGSDPLHTEAFNTTADVARMRIEEIDEDGIATDFKSLTINIGNNIAGDNYIGTLGARYINVGAFEVSVTAQAQFTSPAVLAAIRDNTTVSLDFILANNDGVIAVDLPAVQLGGGGREYPENQSVLVNLTAEASENEFGTSIGVSIFPVPIPS